MTTSSQAFRAIKLPIDASLSRTHKPPFDALPAAADHLQCLLIADSISGTQIVHNNVWRIHEYDGDINLEFVFAEDALQWAHDHERERAHGQVSSQVGVCGFATVLGLTCVRTTKSAPRST